MAANHHPEHAKVLKENQRAFYRKTGEAGTHLNNSKNAVERKTNQCLEKSRMVNVKSNQVTPNSIGFQSKGGLSSNRIF